MPKYTALTNFVDADNGGLYLAGDIYPREGCEPGDERIAELSGSRNKLGKPVIRPVAEPEKPAEIKQVAKAETETTQIEQPEKKRGRRKS